MSSQFRIKVDGPDVLIILNGRLIATMPHTAAAELSQALKQVALRAEEHAMRDRIIEDHAILMRAGFPVGLTSNTLMQAEAAKQAAWSSRLRRAMPGGIKSAEKFGTPAILMHKGARHEKP